MELSIDTSTRYASVAISREGGAVVELTWRSDRNHSVELVPAIREVMRRAAVDMSDVKAVFVARGPGGFSALRVGMSTAKSLASALDIPLVSIASLDIEAHPFRRLGFPVYALIDAGRDRLYVGSYDASGLDEPKYEVLSHEELFASATEKTLFCGEGLRAVEDALAQRFGGLALLANSSPPTRRAGVLASLGYARYQCGDADDPSTLQPLYLRSSQVDTAHRTWATT